MTIDSPSDLPTPDDRTNHLDNQDSNILDETSEIDPALQQAIDRLHRLTVWGRWWVVISLWLTVGFWSLWQLRKTWMTLQEHFTWSAIRVGFIFKPIAAIGLGFCIAVTLSTLLWQSRNILWGLPQEEQQLLQRRVLKIHQQGQSHPLWRKVWSN